MTMLTSGVDIIEIDRLRRALERNGERFLQRVFTPQEQSYCAGRLPSLAGRFAVKEAVAKALGTGIGAMNWTDIEIFNDEQGKPHLRLHHQAERMAAEQGLVHWSISISHTESQAIGFVVAMQDK